MLGDTDQILGSVPQNAAEIQNQEMLPQKIGMERAQTAMAPGQKAGETSAVNEANSVTITPQMAKGLKTMTGQSWDQAVGTKWRGDIFTAITTGMTQAKYHQDVLAGKIDIEKSKENAAAERQDQKGEDAKALEDLKAQHKKELEDIQSKHKKEIQGIKDSTKPKPEDKDKDRALKLLNTIKTAQDADAKEAATKDYNQIASKLGLAPIDNSSMVDKAISSIKSAFGGGGKKDDVGDYLKKNGIKDTPANRKWAEGKVNASAE